MRRALILVCALLSALPSAAWAVAWPRADEALLHSSRFWEAHQRADLALLALQKLVAARPDSADALLELGELDLRINDFTAAARVASEIARRFKGSSAARDFATEYRVATRDRLQLAAIRRLVDIDQTQGVREALARLFPDGAPGGAIGMDYYLLLAGAPSQRQAAYAGLRRLADQHPDDPRYRLALARLMLRGSDTRLAGVRLLAQLAERDDVPGADVDHWLAGGLRRLGTTEAPPELIRGYLARNPDDTDIRELRDRQQQALEEQGLRSPARLLALLPRLQQRLAGQLSRPSASSEARDQALLWLERSRDSLAAGQAPLAAVELQAAFGFYRLQYEAQIPIAQELERRGASKQAGELLAAASRLAPSSTWLFETRIRWLIAHGQSRQAIDLIHSRPTDRKWNAQSRDELLAAALDRRAAEELDAGHPEAAASALGAAIELRPGDPWMRYRLAEQLRLGGSPDRGRVLMSEGVRIAPSSVDMRYAQSLYLASLGDYEAAFAAIDGVDPAARTAPMIALRDRMAVARARATAARLKDSGDLTGARAALLDVDPIAASSLDRAADLAYAWIALGDREHGIALVEPYIRANAPADARALLIWADVLNSADEDARLGAALAALHDLHGLAPEQELDVRRLERAHDLRRVRALVRERKFTESASRLETMLAREPEDRELRIARADLYLAAGAPKSARDRYAGLVGEDPEDWDTRLSYIRALTESGDLANARRQLRVVESRMPKTDAELRINLARRELSLAEPAKALSTLEPLLAQSPVRADVLMLAGRAALAERRFALARDYFDRAAATAGADDALSARRERDAIQLRLTSNVEAGVILRHQPGEAGMSQIDALTIPSAWIIPIDYESRFTVRADAVFLDAGRWGADSSRLPLLGTIPTSAAGAVRYTSDTQVGLSPAVGYRTDSLAVDLGATPLGFLLPNVVGGIEWTPTWHSADFTLGVARRAMTSSELSYAGLKDPVSGTAWGGVVQTGPYAGVGIYRERYGISAAVQVSELTGTRVLDNQFFGARVSSSWKFWNAADAHADVGFSINYWNYQHDLSNYTLGDGGYYSPQSYVSLALPAELDGEHRGWSYKARFSPSFSVSQIRQSDFYPDDSGLQAAAEHFAALPEGYSSPVYPGYHSSGLGFSAYAAAERKVTQGLVVGFMLDVDRTDYYHPTVAEVYFRHVFGPWASRTVSPPRPTRPYNP